MRIRILFPFALSVIQYGAFQFISQTWALLQTFENRIFFVCCKNCSTLYKSTRRLIVYLRSHYFAMNLMNIRYMVKYIPPSKENKAGGYLEYFTLPYRVAAALNISQELMGCETLDHLPVSCFHEKERPKQADMCPWRRLCRVKYVWPEPVAGGAAHWSVWTANWAWREPNTSALIGWTALSQRRSCSTIHQ